jgi:hypothetical protein
MIFMAGDYCAAFGGNGNRHKLRARSQGLVTYDGIPPSLPAVGETPRGVRFFHPNGL